MDPSQEKEAVKLIAVECGLGRGDSSLLTPGLIKKKMKYFAVPGQETWRVGCLEELLGSHLEVPGFTDEETEVMVSYLCKT